jgi:stage III sporulation protein AD
VEIIQIVGFGLVATILIIVIKQKTPQIAFTISILVGTVIFLLLLDKIQAILNVIQKLALQANVDVMYLSIILKIIGIAYITEFGSQVVRDAGEGAIAAKIELAGKILILVLAIPIIQVIIETILRVLP